MTRGDIRTMLRREVRDKAGVEWSDTELNATINVAYGLVQKEIRKVFPEAHISWDRISIVAGTNWYNLPETFSLLQVDLKDTSSGLYYPIDKKPYKLVGPVRHTSGAVEVTVPTALAQNFYSIRGQFIGLFPTPTVSVTDGLQIQHCPIMQLGADAEVPKVKVPVHIAIVWWSKLITLGDTDESTGETRMRLQETLGDLGSWYDQHEDAPDKLIVDS